MRRSSVVLLLSVVAIMIAAGGLTLASSSAAPRSLRLVICPQFRGPIISCCGPPVTRANAPTAEPISCCPPTARCAPALTIGTTPNPSTANGQVMISGRILRTASTAASVVLWQQLPGQQRFQRTLQTTTDVNGSYSVTRGGGRVQTNRRWYVTADRMQSQTINQYVQAVVTLKASAARGGLSAFAGHVTPSHKGEHILLERRTSRGWQVIARPRLDRSSNFGIKRRLPAGTSEVQAIFPADKDNVRSVSSAVTVQER